MTSTFPLLRNCCISCSGLDPKEKASIHQRVEELGACISFNLTTAVTHVIMRDNSLSSVKYKMAAKAGIPVVTVQFVADCETEAKRLAKLLGVSRSGGIDHSDVTVPEASVDGHSAADFVKTVTEKSRLFPFSGCHISATGVDHQLLEDIKHLVVNSEPAAHSTFGKYAGDRASDDEYGARTAYMRIGGGGSYCNALTRRCTHLIAANRTSQKFVFAKQWKIHIVSVAWFLDSVKSQFRQDESTYTFANDSASFSHLDAEYSSLGRPQYYPLSADPELHLDSVGGGYVTTSAQTTSFGSSILSRNHTAASTSGQNESVDLPRGLSMSPEADIDDAAVVELLPSKHYNRLLTRRCKAASDTGTSAPPLIPYATSVALSNRVCGSFSDPKRLPPPPTLLENRWDDMGAGPYTHVALCKEGSEKQMYSLAVQDGAGSCDPYGKRGQPCASNDRNLPRSRTSPGEFGDRDGKRTKRTSGQPISSSPRLHLSAPSENSALVLPGLNPDSHRLGVNSGVGSEGVFHQCVFTSLGFPANTLAVLQDVVSANGGHYSDLLGYVPQPGDLNEESAHLALDYFARHFSDDSNTRNAYLVIQLCGSKKFEQCYSAAQRLHPPIHVVTECWVEQCIYGGVLYPDFRQIEDQSLFCDGLSQGQHILFTPLPARKPRSSDRAMLLSISGYEGLERDHIGKLAAALGIEFSERFSRKASHLICHPPYQGTKYERALKWGTVVEDAAWVYKLAAATACSVESAIKLPSSVPANVDMNRYTAIETPKRVAFSSIIQGTIPHAQPWLSAQQTATPLAKSVGRQNAGTPGRTPIDISLERNLRRAEENNVRSRRAASPEAAVFLEQTTALDGNKTIDCTDDNGGNKGEAHDDDITQMSPTSFNRLTSVGITGRNASNDIGNENKRLEHVLDGAVIALASRIYHRKNELTALALQLGCRVLSRFDTKQATHLVHQSPREHETLRDYRLALQHNLHVVSPWWLYSCRDARAHVNEADFPYSYHPERRLRLVSNSPSKAQRHNDVASSNNVDTLLPQKERVISPRQSRNMRVPSLTKKQGGVSEGRVSRELASVTGPVAIDDLFGKKTARTSRRYRHTPDNLSAGQSIDSGSEQATNGHHNLRLAVPGSHDMQSHDKALSAEQFEEQGASNDGHNGELTRHRSADVQTVGTDVCVSSASRIDRPRDIELSKRKKWWLTLESVESPGYQVTSPDDVISQDIGASRVGDLDDIPNTGAAESSFSLNASLDSLEPHHLRQKTDSGGKVIGHSSSTIKTDAQHSKSPTSPLGARNGTMIVYSEDIDAITERDQLIQKLTRR